MKPLIKQKSKFKEKIKNFFHFDMDEVTKEEEPQKVFEKIPLINLTRNKIFLGIFLFLVIVNILVGFGIDFLYIRAILGFLFLVTVPGLLIMLCFKIRTVKFWEFLVYTIGLSIAFIMFAGLIVNWTLPALGITDKPLSLYPILICFDIFLVTLGIVGWKRNKDFIPFTFTVPKLDALNNIFFIIPMVFPVLSILGAFLLNNHSSNILPMIMLGSIAVYVPLLTIFRKKMNPNIWPWALLFMSLALLLSFSMRSEYVIGYDIHKEVKLVKLVLLNGVWDINFFKDTYNSCLSLTIFSPILNLFLNIGIEIVFKLLIQIIFCFLPIILFSIYKKIINKNGLCFIACLLFIFQIYFTIQMPGLIRQEIAYIFFSLFFLLLFGGDFYSKKIILLIFGISIIISHYSTSYLFLLSLSCVYLIFYLLKKIWKNNPLNFSLSHIFLIILLIFGFFWTFQITQTSYGLTDTFYKTITKATQVFNQESKSELVQGILFQNINYYSAYMDYSTNIPQSYQKNTKLSLLSGEQISNYRPPVIKKIDSNLWYNLCNVIKLIISNFFKILIFLGIFLCLPFIKKDKLSNYFLFSGFYLLTLFLIAFLPYISISYNFERAFLQTLMFISITAIYAGYKIFKLLIGSGRFIVEILAILTVFFLFFSSFLIPFVIVGGTGGSLIFQNEGDEFNRFYTHNSEVYSINYLGKINNPEEYNFYFDRYSQLKVLSNLPIFSGNILQDIIPKTIDKRSYVYCSYTNNNGLSTTYYKGVLFNLEFPLQFLDENKNKIYNNGGSEIFK